MINIDITKSFIYRNRYWIGYSLVAIGLIIVLVFAGLYIPGGISSEEMQSVVKSDSINYLDFNSLAITNLPYHMLQKLSLSILGVTVFGIKLPSILLAFLSAAGMILILRRWFKPRIGILATLIAITTGQFLFISQDGTPIILYLFWAICLILMATLVTTSSKYKNPKKIAFFIMAALSLYTPLSAYILIAVITSMLAHPHLRYLLKHLSKTSIIIGFVFAGLLTVPLLFAAIKNPSLGLTLLGIPLKWPNLVENLSILATQYLSFSSPGGTTLMTPFFELGSMLIIIIGAYNTFKTRETAKSYIIFIWLACLVPFVILNPAHTTILFLPLVMLMASGLGLLLSHWYNLFPLNPYARIAGLIPLVILVTVLVFSGVDRYVYGYRHDPDLVPNFSKDIKLIPNETKNLIVDSSEQDFYSVLAEHNKDLKVELSPSTDTFLATRKAKKSYQGYKVDEIIVTARQKDGDRFYLYKKITD
ncbi:MAG: glycosyltransferase family 39 protein [Candidatus Saccharibacteria bacterium]